LVGMTTTPGATGTWTTTNGCILSQSGLTATVTCAGTYVLEVSNPNLATCVATDTVIVSGSPDFDAPFVDIPLADITRNCIDQVPSAPTTYQEFVDQGGSATDISGPILISSVDNLTGTGSCNSQIERVFTLTDNCGNSSNFTQVITIDDNIPPLITGGPADLALGCNPIISAADITSVTATDNCTNATITALADVITGGCDKTLTRRYLATDACGNVADHIQTFTYRVDTDGPVITHSNAAVSNGGTQNLNCNPSAQDIEDALGSATASDACDGSVTATAVDGSVISNGCLRSKTRTWTASDICANNASTFSHTVTWKVDTSSPIITLDGSQGANPSIGCNPSAQAIEAALGSASVSDACDNTLTATATDSPVQSNACSRSKTRTFTVTDLCGNVATPVVRTVSWTEDTTAPIINLIGGTANAGCNPSEASILASFPGASVTDACGPLTATFTDSPNMPNGCSMSRTRTWNVSDACGNPAQAVSFIVTWSTDTVAPVINATGTTLALGCNPSTQAIEDALGSATASDACGNITPTVQTSTVTANGCQYSQTRSWTAVDGCGNNSVSAVRTVTWKVDTSAPVIQASGTNNDAGCNPSTIQIALALGSATVSDDCDNLLTASFSDSPVSINGCMREQTRTWTVADACGNNATAVSRTVSWKVDTDAPVVTCSVSGILTVCDGDAINFTSSANDNCDGAVAVNCVRSDGLSISDPFPTGTTTVTCTAVDACGNTGTCNATINVLANPTCDITAPQTMPQCGSTGNQLSATATNASTYSWSVASPGGVVDPWVITSGGNTSTITYTAGNGPAVFTLTVTNELNGQECISQCQISMTCGGGDRFCTYTQGYYGNQGGRNCTGGRTTDLLLTQLATPLIIGDTAIDKSLTLTAADVISGCVYLRLPGGGTAAQLNGDATCSTPTGIALRSNGSFRNILLSQTITLGLNLRVPGSTLGGLAITDKYLVTYASSSGACVDTNAVPVAGTAIVRMIPGAVINYLGANNTVSDLFKMASDALAGKLPAGSPGLFAINKAVSAFNEAFDGCRFFGGFYPTNPLDTTATTGRLLAMESDIASVIAYPNPASEQVSIDFVLNGYDSNVSIEVFDLKGTRVATLYNAEAEADVPYRVRLDAAGLASDVYFYHVTTSKGVFTDKLTIIK
ncbi:MAG: T9SS type A sorting domain-containing protein, partial [Bacteroidota bacterium]